MGAHLRLGVLDVGSNAAQLQVVDVYPGASPEPLHVVKAPTGLAASIDSAGVIGPRGLDQLAAAVRRCVKVARQYEVAELVPFATSAVRDAPNRLEACARIREASGIAMGFFSGENEARLAFLAARRWCGWSCGRLLLLDIGGGSVEIAFGYGETPELALSLPIGAGRLTRRYLAGDPPSAEELKRLRKKVVATLEPAVAMVRNIGDHDRVVGTSRILTQLAKLTRPRGSALHRVGAEHLRLDYRELRRWTPKLAEMNCLQRARLRGISAARAPHMVAGAIVARTMMELLELTELELCPWGLREGILLRHLDGTTATAPHPTP